MTESEQRPLAGFDLLEEYLAWREEAIQVDAAATP